MTFIALVPALLAARSRIGESLVRRAERAGYGAIVVTLDTWTLGWRKRDPELAPESSPEAARDAIMLWAGLFGNPGCGGAIFRC